MSKPSNTNDNCSVGFSTPIIIISKQRYYVLNHTTMITLKSHLYLFAYVYNIEFYKLHISMLYENESERENDSERTIGGHKKMEITRE